MIFTDWLKDQQYRNSAVGDLAKDFIRDGCPKNFSYIYLKGKGAANEALVTFKKAVKEFKKLGHEL